MEKQILKLAIDRFKGYEVNDVKITSSESGAYYGSIKISKSHSNVDFRVAFVFFQPNILSLTNSLKEIDKNYINYINRMKAI